MLKDKKEAYKLEIDQLNQKIQELIEKGGKFPEEIEKSKIIYSNTSQSCYF